MQMDGLKYVRDNPRCLILEQNGLLSDVSETIMQNHDFT